MYTMYTQLSNWKTSLFYCECESCFVSYALPCHVYAKLKQQHYAMHCFVYLSLWFMLQFLQSWNYYRLTNACPQYEIHYCLQLTESECDQHYMMIDSTPSKCVYHTDIELCTYDTYSCIPPNVNKSMQTFLFISIGMMYTCFWVMYYTLRKEIREKKEIDNDRYNCLATTCCSTCGLAQEYREL